MTALLTHAGELVVGLVALYVLVLYRMMGGGR